MAVTAPHIEFVQAGLLPNAPTRGHRRTDGQTDRSEQTEDTRLQGRTPGGDKHAEWDTGRIPCYATLHARESATAAGAGNELGGHSLHLLCANSGADGITACRLTAGN